MPASSCQQLPALSLCICSFVFVFIVHNEMIIITWIQSKHTVNEARQGTNFSFWMLFAMHKTDLCVRARDALPMNQFMRLNWFIIEIIVYSIALGACAITF